MFGREGSLVNSLRSLFNLNSFSEATHPPIRFGARGGGGGGRGGALLVCDD